MNTKVFSPIVQSSLPAQTIPSTDTTFSLTIPFEVPSLVNIANVKHMQVTIVDQQTNKYVDLISLDNSFLAPDKIYYTTKFQNNGNNEIIISKLFKKFSLLELDADFNQDGVVDWDDYTYFSRYFANQTKYPLQIRGDFNRDGVVDKEDAEYLQYHILFPDTYPIYQSGDIDGDGDIDQDDAIALLNYINGNSELKLYAYGDLNKDGEIDDKDLQYLKSQLQALLPYFKSGHLYKIQIRFGYCDLWDNNFSTWKQNAIDNGNFSEWSTVMTFKAITEPSLEIINSSPTFTLQPTFEGLAQFADDEEEYVEQYKFTLTSSSGETLDSGWQTHKANNPSDYYKFNKILEDGATYTVHYSIKSTNGYEATTSKDITVLLNTFDKPSSSIAFNTAVGTEENACIGLDIAINTEDLGKILCIVRSTDRQQWDELYRFTAINDFIYYDFAIENGIEYYYGIQTISGNAFSNIKSINTGMSVYFDYAYLVGEGGRQLKMKYDFKINSFKHTVLASKQDTLGSKYPTILRNGTAYYAEFPISGLISFNMDEEQYFAKHDEGFSLGDIYRGQIGNDDVRQSPEKNQFYEKQFRDKVEAFLNDGKYKLFKSATEGNFIVTLMNVTLTPNATLGRMIYSFSATAYEVAEVNLENLKTLGIVQTDNLISANAKIQLGSTLTKGTDNLWTTVSDTLTNMTLSSISNISISTGTSAVTLIYNEKNITIPASRTYNLPAIITENDTVSITGENLTIDYIYTAQLAVNVVEYEYGTETSWGQLEIQDKCNILEQIPNNAPDGSKVSYIFKQLDISAPENSIVTLDGSKITIGTTNTYFAPSGEYSEVYVEPSTTELTLVDYYCIINWRQEIKKEDN